MGIDIRTILKSNSYSRIAKSRRAVFGNAKSPRYCRSVASRDGLQFTLQLITKLYSELDDRTKA